MVNNETIREECEENRQLQRDIELLDKLNNTKALLPKNYLCRIGHDLHGHFDPNHVDFEILCGIVHTEKAAIMFPYLSGLFLFLSTLFFVISGLYYFLPLMVINVPILVLLRFGITRRNHRMMLPFLITVAIESIFWLLTIIACCVIVFLPRSPEYKMLQSIFDSNFDDFQLAVLFVILLFSIDFFAMAYINWNIFFHYIYLMHLNTNCCCHTHECPGKKDVDPKFHRKTVKNNNNNNINSIEEIV